MADKLEYDEADNLNKMKKVRFRGCGWVSVPGGPGPDSEEAKAFVKEQRRLFEEELKKEKEARLNG